MQKALLMSILVATVAIPMVAASSRSAKHGLRRTIVWMSVFNLCYLIGVIYVLPRLPF